MKKLEGKIAVITGSANGIGRAIAFALAREGAIVVVNDIQEEAGLRTIEQIHKNGGEAIFVKADVSVKDEVARMAEEILKKFNRVDILVNNAGFSRVSNVVEMTDEQWDAVVNACLKGTFLCTRAFLKQMIRQRWGRIVSTSSIYAWQGAPGFAQYAAAKAGIIAFTKVLALEVAQFGITVNAIAPGIIGTEGVRSRLSPDFIKKLEKDTPLGRLGTPEDLIGPIILLVSPEGSYITGETICVSGGLVMK